MFVRSVLVLGSPVLVLAAAPFLAGASASGPADVGPGDGRTAPGAVAPVLVIPRGIKLSIEDLILMLPPEIQVEVLDGGKVVLKPKDGSEQTFTVVVGDTVLDLGGDSRLILSLDGSASFDFQPSTQVRPPGLNDGGKSWNSTVGNTRDPGDSSPDRRRGG